VFDQNREPLFAVRGRPSHARSPNVLPQLHTPFRATLLIGSSD
jgi:hypothetical protein